jgi:VCBS repeat protein
MTRLTLRSLALGIGLLGGLTLVSAPTATSAVTTTGCNAIARSNDIGPGTDWPSGAPDLSLLGSAVIGTPFAFRVSGGQANVTGFLICAPRGQQRFLPAHNATFYPKDVRIIEPFTLDANGNSPQLLVQPALPAGACGSTWICQAVVEDWFAPGGRSFTQGLRFRVGHSDGQVGTQLQFTVGATGGSVVRDLGVGDLNADGINDLLTCEGSGSLVHAYMGMSDGTYAAPLITDLGLSMFRYLEIPDLTADGIPDLVVVQGPSNNFGTVRSYVGLGDGQFSAMATRYIPPDARGLTIGDLDDDGTPDVIVPTWGHGSNPQYWGQVSVLYGNGSGSFTLTLNLDFDFGTDATIADVNGDGIKDIVSTSDYSGEEYTHLGLGSRSFAWPLHADSPLVHSVNRIASGDFNGDGIADLVEAGSLNMLVRLGVGNGTFVDGASMLVEWVTAIEVADLSGDGVLDLAVSSNTEGILVFLGKGDGTFADAQQIAAAGGARSVQLIDIDRDGDLDLAGVQWIGGTAEFITLLQD